MIQGGILAQHDLKTGVAKSGNADAFDQGHGRAVFQHQQPADMAGVDEIQFQQIGDGHALENAQRDTALGQRQRSGAHHIADGFCKMLPRPIGRVRLRQVELFHAGRQSGDLPFGHRRADAGLAQRRLEIGIFPFLHAAMRHAPRTEKRGGFIAARFGQAHGGDARHAGTLTICS
jgi:hypothetical protein